MGLGGKMYKYLNDPSFEKALRKEATKLTTALAHQLKIDNGIGVSIQQIGSAKRNMITQNSNEPVDIDWNLIINKSPINDAKELKNAIMKTFNKVLKNYGYENCQDSTSVISTKYANFKKGNQTKYKFDIAIVREDANGNWERLIHEKTGYVQNDRWYWNKGPNSKDIKNKAEFIKSKSKWNLVLDEYLKIKNANLSKNGALHSFTCYERAVNDVYNHLKNREKI